MSYRIAALALATSALFGRAAVADGPAPAAKASAPDILQKMEAKNNGYADQQLEERITVVDVDGTRKSYDMTLFQKGSDKRVVQFTSGEMKGMSMLVEDRSSVYVYLPGFKKVRRVAPHDMKQTLVGSDLSNDDMATVSWAVAYDVKLDKEDDTSWWLVLTPKDPASEYSKVVHRVDKATFNQEETHYYGKTGEETKRMMCSDLATFDGITRYKTAVFSDPRTGHRTELETRSAKYNQGLDDDLFTVRQLQFGK